MQATPSRQKRSYGRAQPDVLAFKEPLDPQARDSGSEDARRIIQPVLAVVGTRSLELDPIWGERHQLLLDWLPNVESFVLPDAMHLLQIENPHGMAEGLAAFFARYPLAIS